MEMALGRDSSRIPRDSIFSASLLSLKKCGNFRELVAKIWFLSFARAFGM